MNEKTNRKNTRLCGADYNQRCVVFLTICTKERKCTLSRIVENSAVCKAENNAIVGIGVLDGPKTELTRCGKIADKYINQLNAFYDDISVEEYVIMPNHIHIMLWIKERAGGPSGTPVPTLQNSRVAKFVSTFKRFSNKEYGTNIWQYRSNDHIIRNGKDYEEHIKYIRENPMRWYYDELYREG